MRGGPFPQGGGHQPVLLRIAEESQKCRNLSLSGLDRMDNVLKVHSSRSKKALQPVLASTNKI